VAVEHLSPNLLGWFLELTPYFESLGLQILKVKLKQEKLNGNLEKL
jgi:hypothetical protein